MPALTATRLLTDLAATQRRRLSLAAACGLLEGVLIVFQAGLFAWVASALLVDHRSLDRLTLPFILWLSALPLRGLLGYARETLAQDASLAVRKRLRRRLLDHLARLGPVQVAGHHTASLAYQAVEQVEALDGYFSRFRVQLVLAVAVPLTVLGITLYFDWLAALFLLLAAPLIPLFMALVGMGAERLNREQFAAVSRLSGHFIDRVRSLTTLRLFGQTERATQSVHAAADGYRVRSMRTLRLAFLSSAVLEFFASVAIAVVAIYVGFGLLGYIRYGPADELTLFSGLLILLLAPEFFQPLRSLAQHYHDRAAALGAAEHIAELLDQPVPATRRGDDASPSPASDNALLALDRASVVHPGRGTVLGPVTVTVGRGETIVVTGASGSGKSTLLQLAAGFVAPDKDGARRRAPDLRFAWMDQRPLLVHGTLADNLRLADPEADDAALARALESAHLGELLAGLPRGLETPVGERGAGLSGGQAQRLALARVFLSAAPLVLLDEPTASLDAQSEQAIMSALEVLQAAGRTLIISTHHPALIALADRRWQLDQGRLEEVPHG
ncbi:thiol reductant ABC exporter subunit CydD [Halomonas piscis]|uniref:Thiol reductant ABC exporter subunit CydD n=1 Tax=Halomonas piscis TaxID=3031727 RepID=A0ABY9YZF6_9GAMM|nr:thiol reductant ABC exporter subunit CydD [Halomonas piscis]WNK19958.1 thiol reductant ABC exporter subunit CydD [Halomonas piscis]